MDYTETVATLALLVATTVDDANFLGELPDALDYANLRMCRDLDFLQTRMAQTGPALTPGSRNVSMAALTYPVIVLEQVNVITPPATAPDAGTRNPLTRWTRPYMDMMYPTGGVPTSATVPVDFAMVDEESIVVGPVSDLAYGTEFFGTVRPEVISEANPTTWINDNLPDVFIAAAMIRLSGWMKNYGNAMADDPQQPVSWEQQYRTLLDGAGVEEARRKAQSASWSDQKPLPQSNPPRA